MCKRFDSVMFWCFLWIGCFFSSFQRGLAQGSSSNTDPGGGKSPPLEITVKLGSDVILPCDAVDPNQQSQLFEWRKNGSKSAIFIKFMNFKPHIDSRYSRRLHMINSSAILLSGAKESDSGIYRCRTMQSGSESAILTHGRWIVLKVTGKASLPSRRKTVVETYPAVLDCLIDSNLPSENVIYSWTKNGVDASSDARATILASGALFIKPTRKTDSGVYKCSAKTFDSSGLVTYPGSDIMLDVQYKPTITDMPDTVAAPEGSDARLPCVSVGNPSTHFTNWTRHGESLTSHPRFAVLEKGSLLIQNVRRTDAGEYVCTPYNKVGAGASKTTKLVLKVVPKFIVAPPSIMTLRVGDDVTLVCEATSDSPPKLSWEREEMPFPAGRTDITDGKLVITAIQKDDYGVYTCIATSDDAQAKHSTTIAVISTPSEPTITSVLFNRATAVVKWRPGYDGGYPQQLEVWYRLVTDNDYEWHRSSLLPASVTSYKIPGLQPEHFYYFSIRGINREGAGHFSGVVEARGTPPVMNRSPDKADKPLAPENVIVNITKDGYYIMWTHTAVPGRPEVEKFVVEYREGNGSSTWLVAAAAVPEERRVYLFEAEMIEADKTYDFRVFAFGANEFSEAAYVSKTYKLGSPVIGQPSGKSDVIPIIAGVLGAIVGIFLLGLVCFCFIHRKSRKENISKSGDKKVHFTLPDGTTEAYEPEESDEDFLDAEIKLRPEAVRFIPDDSDGSEDEKFAKLKREEDLLLTGHDGRYGVEMLRYAKLVGNSSPPRSPANSSEEEKVHYFGDLESRDGQTAWYDCTLSKPASREVRDSYDQFCKNDIGSRDSILSHKSPPGFGRKASFEHLGTKAYVVQKFGSNHSLPDKRDSSLFRNPRFQPIQEEVPRDRDVPRGNPTLGRRQPHHWSTPAVFTRRQDSNNNSDRKGSDSDSGDSSSRGRKGRRHRPHSLYEGKLRPISEQDSDSKLRCTCDEEEESDEGLKYAAHKGREGSGTLPLRKKVPDTESSYLHLERADSQRLSFTEQLKSWSEASLKGEPYDKHSKNKNPVCPLDTDSENSVSPAISMVSLSETESDREIARNLYDSRPNTTTSGSLTRQTDAVALPRAVTNLKSVDSESSSDEQGRPGSRERSRKPSPPVYKDKKPPSVTDLNLNPIERADSMDQLKICDPFFQERHRVSRSSSNASSGICSVVVSSSETNSIESPRESTSKRSSRSSDRTSSDRASSGYGSSRDSYEKPVRIKPADYSKAHAQMRLKGTRFSPADDPYELDPSSSEMDDLETEGAAYNPQVFEDLMTLQQEMGVNLEGSDSSRESLKEMEKLSNSDLLKYSLNVSPTKYKVYQLSDAEKDQRCSKLMAEYKTNKKLQDVKNSGSQVYRSWDL